MSGFSTFPLADDSGLVVDVGAMLDWGGDDDGPKCPWCTMGDVAAENGVATGLTTVASVTSSRMDCTCFSRAASCEAGETQQHHRDRKQSWE